MAVTLNALTTGVGGLQTTADTSGVIALQSNGTTSVTINSFGIGLGSAVPSSGIGIQFPATQSASSDANCLDDYEEGTWTPTLVGSTSGSATITSTTARYIKIGKQVTIWAELTGISRNTLSGIARFSLPFTASAITAYPTGVMRYTGLTNMGTSTVVDPVVSPATAFIFFQSKNSTGFVVTDLTNSNFNTTFDLYMINLTYEVA
jgi:hypothetical protein